MSSNFILFSNVLHFFLSEDWLKLRKKKATYQRDRKVILFVFPTLLFFYFSFLFLRKWMKKVWNETYSAWLHYSVKLPEKTVLLLFVWFNFFYIIIFIVFFSIFQIYTILLTIMNTIIIKIWINLLSRRTKYISEQKKNLKATCILSLPYPLFT